MTYNINKQLLFLPQLDRQKIGPDNSFLNNSLQPTFNSKIPFQINQGFINRGKNIDSDLSNTNRILIVDDETDIARLFKITLQKEGFIVDVFNDPTQALSCYKSGYYDLLLLDVKMPQMSGFELYEKIRKNGDDANVCFITAFEEYQDEFRRTYPSLKEVDCFIRKPIELDKLIKIIRKRLNKIS